MRLAAAFTLVLVGLFLGAAGGENARERLPGILGSDDRVILDTSAWPWAAVGRVNRETGGFARERWLHPIWFSPRPTACMTAGQETALRPASFISWAAIAGEAM